MYDNFTAKLIVVIEYIRMFEFKYKVIRFSAAKYIGEMLIYFAVVFFSEVAYNLGVLVVIIEAVFLQAPDISAVDIESFIKKHALGFLLGA